MIIDTTTIQAPTRLETSLTHQIPFEDAAKYIKQRLNGTLNYVDFISANQSYELDDYFALKYYEGKYNMTSSDMFTKWNDGELVGTDITDWVMSYMAVKDRLYASNN